MKRGFTLVELLVVVCIIGVIASIIFGVVQGGTSEGYRDGYIQKFSLKHGYISSSHEGELAMAGFGGSQANKLGQQGGNVWGFYATDPTAIKAIEDVDSSVFVRAYYTEHRWSWGHWTNYEVTKLEIRKPMPER